ELLLPERRRAVDAAIARERREIRDGFRLERTEIERRRLAAARGLDRLRGHVVVVGLERSNGRHHLGATARRALAGPLPCAHRHPSPTARCSSPTEPMLCLWMETATSLWRARSTCSDWSERTESAPRCQGSFG